MTTAKAMEVDDVVGGSGAGVGGWLRGKVVAPSCGVGIYETFAPIPFASSSSGSVTIPFHRQVYVESG